MALTTHLLSLRNTNLYIRATQHDFLTSGADLTLSSQRLALFLSQDRIYAAHAYPKFIGALISRIPFSGMHAPSSIAESRNQRILSILAASLNNIIREVKFFKETADKWGLNIEGWRERKATRDYTAEMARVVEGGIVDGLVFLWAMEQVYLDSWTYVKTHIKPQTPMEVRANPSEAPLRSLMNNWTSPEFVSFVQECMAVVDLLGIEAGTKAWARAEEIWARVLELEIEFWPQEGEETVMRARHGA